MQAATASFLDVPLETVPDFGQRGGWKAMREFFARYGYELVESGADTVPAGYYFVVGVSTQLHDHIVIYQMGRLVHDPNPHGRGLIMQHYVLWPKPS
jgi:hypothetical protein